MQVTFKLVCIIIALVCFAVGAFGGVIHPRLNLTNAGLFFLTLALFVNA